MYETRKLIEPEKTLGATSGTFWLPAADGA